MAIRKPPDSLQHNYKGFFPIIRLALVDADHKFRWIDAGTEHSCSHAQSFNENQLRDKIKDGFTGNLEASSIVEDGPDVSYSAEQT